jgi:probable HAF family extracellular repeat protein
MKTLVVAILSTLLGFFSASPAKALFHAFLWNSDTGMIDLGGLVEGEDSYANGINESGQVVGFANVASLTPHAFIWSEETGMIDIGTPGGASSIAWSINSEGAVVGEGYDANGVWVAFLWTSGDGFVVLGRAGDLTVAYDINEANWITGARSSGPIDSGFIWNGNSDISRALGVLPGGTESVGRDINDLNHVTGTGTFADASSHVFLWTKANGISDVGRPAGAYATLGMGLNNNDEIVGYSDAGRHTTPFYWSSATGFRVLQKLPNSPSAYAFRINNLGQIVGTSSAGPNTMQIHAVLWPNSLSAPRDLGTLGGTSSSALAINDHGQIVGHSLLATSNQEK